jgi:hypothetical protein
MMGEALRLGTIEEESEGRGERGKRRAREGGRNSFVKYSYLT